MLGGFCQDISSYVYCAQEKMCEESASFDWTSGDIASAIRDLKELSDKLSAQISAEENGAYDMADNEVLAGGLSFFFSLSFSPW